MCRLFVEAHRLSLVAVSGVCSLVAVHRLLIAMASRYRVRALGAWTSVLVA